MVACLCLCHVPLSDMSCLSPATGTSSRLFCSFDLSLERRSLRFGFWLQRNGVSFRRSLRFVSRAELSKSFSPDLGLDSQAVKSHDTSNLPWIGPVPGDIAEVEAYCRIFRAAERLHGALMETLCNPLTGECRVPYEFSPEEKPLLEDKIVSVLGCLLSLLNKGRKEIISGRSSFMDSFSVADVSVTEELLPPLAVFRGEMKRCCESLHIALENYLMPDDERSGTVWRKLQWLKNVCYDAGFPRRDNYPSHTIFANWDPVYFSNTKEDFGYQETEVAFWRGGQVTEEGLKWLVEKGYKTIVDLRAEDVKDTFYEATLEDAISRGKIELVKIPVEVRMAPSAQQVEQFASLVSDCSKRPIYLHSKEGVWRTSAMVSRWKQYMTRSMNKETPVLEETKRREVSETKPGSKAVYRTHVPQKLADDVSGITEFDSSSVSKESNESKERSNEGQTSVSEFSMVADPLKSQVPPLNVFSRKEMSAFLKNKGIAPAAYLNNQYRTLGTVSSSQFSYVRTTERNQMIDKDALKDFSETGNSNGSLLSLGSQGSDFGNGTFSNGDVHASSITNKSVYVDRGNGFSGEPTAISPNVAKPVRKSHKSSGASPLDSSDDEIGSIEGNMCASATGVVRVQSRKKAEMFLVRTDGFSCTREKVTESSLAFTHPSTQQQMLLWKSTPKTVLLLKKLGQELMEEAKEAASFLYYQEKMNVLVEPEVHDVFARIPGFGFVQTFYIQDTSDLHERVDFVACLGGDGVILHASNLFKGAVPPVVSFNLGSLGFLTSHTFENFRQDLRRVIHGNNMLDGVYITLRLRLRCEIYRNGKAMPGKVFDVLNEIVVDRGSNPYLSKIECYEHDRLITKVQGDGVIVATPTGSTAYSTAAGGSMVHPNVPCMLFTPICPHSLSFRPVILPDSARLELKIPEDARSNAWVSFDGKRRQQLSRGDSVRIYMSEHPLPTVNKSDQTGDWFRSLIRCLNWNERLDQKAL
ncbi:PREDICTED: NAD kinase 2, chloroplastic-like isoform X1 [Tarenaya hassleriana]|uniref:NAD kinase 2, chloroplastic-like isoform X1 n=2 Tax=Tarenaya hassleriana TaxID=28532 RepID=UPI00053C339E|nr:PREDICTED: NAD kinase 2, chloroplastic-like isoform X1 [Tarenaya hassleriana]